jgi:plastocyanin
MRRTLPGAILALAAVLPACGGNGADAGPATSPTPAPAPNAVNIAIVREDGPRSFSPNPAPAGGQMVVFRNADMVIHRVRLNDDESIDTGDLLPGATSRAVQMPAGGAHYHCTIHPGMIGSVTAAGGAPPPPCEGPYCGE